MTLRKINRNLYDTVPENLSMSMDKDEKVRSRKLPLFFAPLYLAMWFILFFAVVIPSYSSSPSHIEISEEKDHFGKFIGQRAEQTLVDLSSFGEKSVGSAGYHLTTKYLLDKIHELSKSSRADLYDIEIDHQIASGKMLGKDHFNVYKDISNVVTRIKPRNLKTNASLLLNSHYDSAIGSPGVGDDSVMVAIMMEIFRVISLDEKPLDHPVIFLFNGGEEILLLGSHAFITSHAWFKDVKAVINLDSAGNGGREMVFQSGPNHPWLMKYYKESVPYPFVSTVAEELFQRGIIPSDTDYRIFNEVGGIPGLNLAHINNGYVYHLKYDNLSVMPKRTYQHTGGNLLALTRRLANAKELDGVEDGEGGAVFFDVAGWFMVFYTETQGYIINIAVSALAIGLMGFHYNLVKEKSKIKVGKCFIIFGAQVLAFAAICVGNMSSSYFIDLAGLALSWFTNKWLIFGLYCCPVFFCFGTAHSMLMKNFTTDQHFILQMIFSSQSLILILVTWVLTGLSYRSSFMFMISVLFYSISLAINIITKFYEDDFLWIIPHCLLQLIPFCFYTYVLNAFMIALIPMQGRSGPSKNPEFTIMLLSTILTVLVSGFIIPILNVFGRIKTFAFFFGAVTVTTLILITTPVGFPFKAETSFQRYQVRHTNRLFYDINGRLQQNDSGFALITEDRRMDAIENHVDLSKSLNMELECRKDIFCGVPLCATDSSIQNFFIPGPEAEVQSNSLSVTLTNKQALGKNHTRFEFEIEGPDHIYGAVTAYAGSKLTFIGSGSSVQIFNNTPFVTFSLFYGQGRPVFRLLLDFEKAAKEATYFTFRLTLVAHHVHRTDWFTDDFKAFLGGFPDWVYTNSWISEFYRREF